LSLGTFGLLTWLAFVVAYFVLNADFRRRGFKLDAGTVAAACALAGIAGAKLWHVLESPHELAADPARELFSRTGFAWFGGFFAAIATLIWFARRYRIPILAFLDACAPAAAIGYGVGRIGCLLSGDGDYGRPTNLPWGMSMPNGLVPTTDVCRDYGWPANCGVHPTPIYELIAMLFIAWWLWREGKKGLRGPRPNGLLLAQFFVLTGAERFLVEFIRINPRAILGMSNAQFTALLTAVFGVALMIYLRKNFRAQKGEHRIVEHYLRRGDVVQPEYHRATEECPHPERWRMYDSMTAEMEVLEFLKALVRTLKPELIVETGTFMGISTLWMAEALKENGSGKIVTCEYDAKVFAAAKERIEASGLGDWIDARNESSLETKVNGTIDLLFSDSDPPLREQEVRRFLAQMRPTGLILMHDASSHLKTVREAALRMEAEGLISVVLMPTPRGLVIAQKREGRR
jgi:prolipoprotein diacylglyceryltransferase/predicted O-methyltransferase YrrM